MNSTSLGLADGTGVSEKYFFWDYFLENGRSSKEDCFAELKSILRKVLMFVFSYIIPIKTYEMTFRIRCVYNF